METKLKDRMRASGLFGVVKLKGLGGICERIARIFSGEASEDVSSFSLRTSEDCKPQVLEVYISQAVAEAQRRRNLHNI